MRDPDLRGPPEPLREVVRGGCQGTGARGKEGDPGSMQRKDLCGSWLPESAAFHILPSSQLLAPRLQAPSS